MKTGIDDGPPDSILRGRCGREFITLCNRAEGHKGQCSWESPRKLRGDQFGKPERVTETQENALGRDIDTLDNLAHALLLPTPVDFHVRQLKASLPELIEKLKNHYADAFGWDPWEHHPNHVRIKATN